MFRYLQVSVLAALITDQVDMAVPLVLNDLPLSVLQGLGLDAEKLQPEVPVAETFSDISMLLA